MILFYFWFNPLLNDLYPQALAYFIFALYNFRCLCNNWSCMAKIQADMDCVNLPVAAINAGGFLIFLRPVGSSWQQKKPC